MRRAILAALVLALAMPAQAQSQTKPSFMTGNLLHEACTLQKATSRGVATGYAVGVLDSPTASSKLIAFICVPSGVTMGQVVDVACAYVAKNSQDRHREAAILVFGTLVDAWPCQDSPPAQ
ncbi:hypothetical protein KHHGKMAE_0099 [Methylobacterium persicinum]|jgi:hypothetical protein|nr:hypothetical protein KHHGKMAE_0099 [Methylobacterium persicinum]